MCIIDNKMNKISKVAERVYKETSKLKTPPIEVAEVDIDFFKSITPKEFNLLGVGGSRIVYENNNHVFKFINGFDEDPEEKSQMEKEINIWKESTEKQKDYLLNIVDYDNEEYKWLKSNQLFDEEYILHYPSSDIKRKIRNELEENNIIFKEGLETNVVYKNGKITVLDYGYNTYLG